MFSINTRSFENLMRKVEYRWPKIDRLGRRPARQWIGVGDDRITLKGVVFPNLDVGLGLPVGTRQIEQMRQLAEQGSPYDLITGTGQNLGKWVITDISETQHDPHPDGQPRKQEYDMDLGFYGSSGFGLDGVVFANGLFFTPRLQLNASASINIGGVNLGANLSLGLGV
jgi:uncharacterized protein